MMKIEYYEGAVQAAKSQLEPLEELLDVLNQKYDIQKQKVYEAAESHNKEEGAVEIEKKRVDELIESVNNGTFSTDMLKDSEQGLADSLIELSRQQEHNKEVTDKVAEAKKKLAKQETDLAIAADMAAGNYELAAARVELALASEVYSGTEAAEAMARISKDTNSTMREELLEDMSPDLKANFDKYVTTTEQGKKDLAKIYSQMNEEERKAFSKSYENEAGGAMQKAIKAMQEEISNASFDWSHPFKSLGSIFSGDWSWKAKYASFDVGTNYVPNDGFAYIHKGEAIIPADQNIWARQGAAFTAQTASNTQLLAAITELNMQLAKGIAVQGQFVQRGADLVATVEKANNKLSNNILNNRVYAR